MITLLIPGTGFGYWNVVGKLLRLNDECKKHNINFFDYYDLTSYSSGSLVAYTLLLQSQYLNYDILMSIAKKVKMKLRSVLNLYEVNHLMFKSLKPYLDKRKVEKYLPSIKVITTQVGWLGLYHTTQTASDVDDFIEISLASSHIPILSRQRWSLCYHNKYGTYIDGGISEYIYPSVRNQTVISTTSITNRIPTEKECKDMFMEGYGL